MKKKTDFKALKDWYKSSKERILASFLRLEPEEPPQYPAHEKRDRDPLVVIVVTETEGNSR